MPRTRRPRLSWFRFYPDDFVGGICALTAAEVGQYVLLLCAQWGSKEAQVVPPDLESLTLICRGVPPSDKVLSKFEEVPNGLRNKRLAGEWADTQAEYEGKSRRSKGTHTAPHTAPHTGTVTVREPEPEPENVHTDLPTAHTREPGEAFNKAEQAMKDNVRRLQLKLGGLLTALAEHENSRLMVPAWCKRVTAYEKSKGVSDFRMISSPERLERSIADAEWWIEQMNDGRKVT